ncbi:MAG: hypothetical protein M0036_26570 [Desulfobacteraceae bacterium]|nr:hypothetical protein [Desulfobacteraceae bacterium]
MNLKAKAYEEQHQQVAQAALAARIALLESKGIAAKIIEKDSQVKKLKADVRKAKHRLMQVAAQEKLQAQKKEAKAAKIEAEKAAKQPAQAPKAKKEKEEAKPAKKEKKPKQKKEAPAAQ